MDSLDAFRAPEARLFVAAGEADIACIRDALKGTRVHIDAFSAADQIRGAVSATPYHLLIIVHEPPEADGLALIKEIRAAGANKVTPAIVIAPDGHKRAEYRSCGFQDSLCHPLGRSALQASLIKYLPPELLIFSE